MNPRPIVYLLLLFLCCGVFAYGDFKLTRSSHTGDEKGGLKNHYRSRSVSRTDNHGDKLGIATCPLPGQNPSISLEQKAHHGWLYSALYESGQYVSANTGRFGWDFFFPCSRSMKGAWKEIEFMMPVKKGQFAMGVPGMDLLNHKLRLPMYLKKKNADIFPPSYSVISRESMQEFYRSEHGYEYFILKTYKHLQKGLLVVKGKDEVREAIKKNSDFVLLQPVISPDLLTDKFGKPTSLRIYVMVKCTHEGGMEVSYHPWLRVKYAGAKNVTDIATSSNYEGPSNLKAFCDQEGCSTPHLTHLIEKIMKDLFKSVRGEMCDGIPSFNTGVFFQLFGADIVISKDMKRTWILEMNKGPNMGIEHNAKTGEGKRLVAGAFFRAAGLKTFSDKDHDPRHYMIPLETYNVNWKHTTHH